MRCWLLALAGLLLLTGRPAAAAPLDEAFAAYQAGAYGKAATLFRTAAERGNRVAQYNLALLYQAGEGVPRDDAQAVAWFRKAAELGDAKAQNELGVVLVSGRGTPRDPVEASRWFEKAAAQGNGDAQFNLDALRRSSRTQAGSPGRSWPLSLPQSLALLAAALIVGWMLLPSRTEDSAAPAAAAATGAPAQGALLAGKYELRGRIGEGGMGIVFEGHDRALDRRVAVKMLRSEFKAQGQARDDFLREARVVSQLTHPFVIAIHEIVEDQDEIYLVFEYVDGESLSAALKRRGRIPLAECMKILDHVCQAVEAAHSCKILHRDLKPSNIMIDRRGFAKVMDFGVARLAKETLSKQTGLDGSGTPAYMAPEQHLGEARRASDVFSLGVCLYEMLTGELPFKGPDYLAQKERGKYAPATMIVAGLPKGVDDVLARALAGERAARFADPLALLDALKALKA